MTDDRPTMTALQLAREAKENDGDGWYGRQPVCVRTADGGLHRAVGFDWDGDLNCFVLTVTESPTPTPLPPVPDALAVAVGKHVFMRDDMGGEPCFLCPGNCHSRPLDWVELNAYAAEQGEPIVPLIPDPADSAPALPWTDGADETEDKIYASGRSVYAQIVPGYILPEEAELRAAVLLRAAREARQS